MSQGVEVPEEIEHLDFEPEEDLRHHKHPTIAGLRWCGTRGDKSYMSGNGTKGRLPTCSKCLRLIDAFGLSWYWSEHRRHYASNCMSKNGVVYHDCGA